MLKSEIILPSPITTFNEKETHFPIEVLPNSLKSAIKDIANFTQTPVSMAAYSVIGACNYAAQTRINTFEVKGYKNTPSSLFLLTVAGSGEGKTSTERIAFKPIKEHESQKAASYKAELAEWKKQLAKSDDKQEFEMNNPAPIEPRPLIGSDASVSTLLSWYVDGASSLTWATDEGGQFFGGHSMTAENNRTVLSALTNLWGNGFGQRVRSKGNPDSSGTFFNRRLSICLSAQECVVRKELSDEIMQGQGILARFLFSSPNSMKGYRLIDSLEDINKSPDDISSIKSYHNRLNELLNTPEAINGSDIDAPTMKITKSALKIWMEYHNQVEYESSPTGIYSYINQFSSRAAEQATRLATLFAFFEGKEQVDDESMVAGVAIAQYSLDEWLRYLDDICTDENAANAKKAINWIIRASKRDKEWKSFHPSRWLKRGQNSLRKADKWLPVQDILIRTRHLLTVDDELCINPVLLEDSSQLPFNSYSRNSQNSQQGGTTKEFF